MLKKKFLDTNLKHKSKTVEETLQFVDFESHARSMGAAAETVKSTSELELAFKRAKESEKTLVSIFVNPKQF